MSSAGPLELRNTVAEARRLTAALDVIESRLSALDPGAGPDSWAQALAEPIQAFDALAKEAIR